MKCKHLIKDRQAVASPSHWGNQIASVICLKCGEVLSSRMIDSDGLELQEPKYTNLALSAPKKEGKDDN